MGSDAMAGMRKNTQSNNMKKTLIDETATMRGKPLSRWSDDAWWKNSARDCVLCLGAQRGGDDRGRGCRCNWIL